MLVIKDWSERVVFAPTGVQPQFFADDERLKVILAGLEPGQKIPSHPEGSAVYHILQGRGWMHVDGEVIPVTEGVTVLTPNGARRGFEAETSLVFLATLATG